jgi:DivIVA domain-containing protein
MVDTTRGLPVRESRPSAEYVRSCEFSRKPFGGLDPDEVRDFQRRIAAEVERLTEEAANARRFPAAEVASRQATSILVHARRTGEDVVNRAQAMAREVAATAAEHRTQVIADGHDKSEAMIAQAREQAASVVAEAAARWPADAQAQLSYLDSFTALLVGQLTAAAEMLRSRAPIT